MEWVETVAKTLAEARDMALDRLGVGEEDAEFEILEEPKPGLFGRVRGEARVRARVRPTAVRPKQDRRSRGRTHRNERPSPEPALVDGAAPAMPDDDATREAAAGGSASRGRHGKRNRSKQEKELTAMGSDEQGTDDDGSAERSEAPVDPAAVGEAAVEFMTGLATAFGSTATASLNVEGNELDVRVDGEDLGLLIGPGGRTLMAVQDLARVAAQRRLGDHETRLRIDVAGYRERRRAALEKFAIAVAHEVRETGQTKALEPMASADRKVVHDSIHEIEGVASHSDGEEPRRRVVITPA
jgi:spoIIIJ-associated protein